MKVLAIMQNQWMRDPERMRRLIERYPNARRRAIALALFAGCRSGRVLRRVFGLEWCSAIIWDEASREIGGHAASVFPADLEHLRAMLAEVAPDVVLAFGRIACEALTTIQPAALLIGGPHPVAPGADTLPRLRAMRNTLEQTAAVSATRPNR